ncbi:MULTISPECIES: hypothetical protein [unclassified Virgibacillus]|uniref:hypothetical protein n=1 Tax=unclassified Virgibacillus TaxID=2620237 RepID=UPI0024DEA43F|nr:hypothetical protein [Virgibacillus sp. LDC-1]
MLGLIINELEQKEMQYLVKRELEELLFDLEDHRIDPIVKQSMRERYRVLFQLLRRVASHEECLKYVPKKTKNEG